MTDVYEPVPAYPQRVGRLPEQDWNDAVAKILGAWRMPEGEGSYVPNPFATLARHPAMLRAWEPFAGTILLRGTLPHRDRELAVLRTALLCRAPYVWGSHVIDHGPEAGLTDEDVARVIEGPAAAGWSEFEAALILAADELHAAARISDETWNRLAASYTEEQMIELPMLVGEYHLMAYTFNSLGVQPEEGFPPLPSAA
jgi:alkylhydroperoxidase family enzyme